MDCIHIIPPSTTKRRKQVRRTRANNMAAKVHALVRESSPIDKLRATVQASCWKPLEGIVGACLAAKYHKQSELVGLMAERMVQRMEMVLG